MASMEEIIAKDLPEVINTMREMGEKVSDIDQHVEKLMLKITSGGLTTTKGVSFLEVKFHLLLSYIIDLTYYLLRKTDGKSWESDPAVDRLVEARTVLEKMRPIDHKMKYQIDKMIKSATTGLEGASNDPLRFKPNPDNMVTKLDDKSGSSDDDDEQKPKLYVPPKVAAVPYDDNVSKKTKAEKAQERSRKRTLASAMLQDLREEYSEAPQEIREETGPMKMKHKEKAGEDERTRYEEDNMLRLPTKKMKKLMPVQAAEVFDELTAFDDLTVLNTEEKPRGDNLVQSSSSTKSKLKRKKKFGSAKKRKGFSKKRRR
ncbi:PREDICTED: neuroguidin-like isoform X2 [Acropora digitifera]|uniref:neuroguidin-like isoform X1 n=1 Tax=Acropora digitifera TaxID=70779 RepID=UPI00077ABB8B|nr:PREDICTED: neuroguidin-like isoform X1 [Acropora digitifera]XP_015777116.1 PREDICTED: neuroguidin-like isoform X2 [Acropora digitifera]